MRLPVTTLLMLLLTLVACGKSPQNPQVPAVATAPAAVSTPRAATAAPATTAAAASTVPAASSAVAATTLAAAAQATSVAPDAATTAGPEVAGQVALAQGSVTDTATDGSSRQLKDGDSVYPGDSFVLGADSYLDMDLEDSGRIMLRPNTSFQIQSYHFDPDAHEPTDASGQPLIKTASAQPENAFFKLVKGGLRAVDGLIGQTHPDKYSVETPVATIGVRGTAFDVRYCGDDCSDEADASGKPENGLYTSVSEGSVDVKNDSGETVTAAGHSGYVRSRKERMQALATPPKALRHMGLPDNLKARAEKNRGLIQQRRQQRRQAILQHRREQLQKAKAGGAGQAKPARQGLKPETPAERREQRLQRREATGAGKNAPAGEQDQRLQKRGEKLRRQEREQQAPAANGQVKPEAQGGAANLTSRELRKEKREERQQQKATTAPGAGTGAAKPTQRGLREERREEHQQQKAAQAPAVTQPKETKPAAPTGDDAKCKDKKKRKDKDKKDKDKCGGD